MVYGSPDGVGQELSPEYTKMIARDEKRWATTAVRRRKLIAR